MMVGMSETAQSLYYSSADAALALSAGLSRVAELEAQKTQYDYSYPPHLTDDIATEARRVRDAVRYLVSDGADED